MIARASRPGFKVDLDFEMTAKILSDFNPGREHTTKTAEALRKLRFSVIRDIYGPRDALSLCEQALAARRSGNYTASTARRLCLMHLGCIHFTQRPTVIFSILRASRKYPLPDYLFDEVGKLIQHVDAQETPKVSIRVLAASALLMDRHLSGLNSQQIILILRVPIAYSVLGFNPFAVFDELFAPNLLYKKSWIQGGIQDLRLEYKRLATLIEQGFDPVSIHRQVLAEVGDLGKDSTSTCWSCFTRSPSRLLTWGYRLCNYCVRVYSRDEEHSYFDLSRCLLCGRKSLEPIYVKPSAAGLRVPRISGNVRDATKIANFLWVLRSRIRAPLYEHFDVVVTSGIGLFFTLMLFCKRESVEDCIHHIPSIKHVRVKDWGFSFGSRLKFERDELQSNKVLIMRER